MTRSAVEIIEAALREQGVEYQRVADDSFAVALPGEKRLKTACLLTVGTRAVDIEAFVVRKPEENHESLANLQAFADFAQRPVGPA